jgi:hypothetical protein
MNEIKFLTQPKNYKTPGDRVGYNIDAISVRIAQQPLMHSETVSLEFMFYTTVGGVLQVHSNAIKDVYKLCSIPNIGDIDFVANLLSYDKTKVYGVATLFAQMYGFILLPLAEQTDLNLM